jgi:hypothetical protein
MAAGALRCSLALLALEVGLLGLHAAHESAIGPYGLIQALPVGYFIALALVLFSFLLTWGSSTPRWPEFVIEVLVLLVLLQGAPAIITSEPLSTGWVIAGFTDYVARTGHVLPDLDARFSWPAFFAGVGLLLRASGLRSSVDLLRWWPLALNMLYLPPLGLISHRILRDTKQTMLVIWLFPLANWVGQDYFSPQSVAFLLYLVLVAIVIGPFGRQRRRLLPWGGTGAAPEREQPTTLGWPEVATLMGALVVLDLAMVTGHQLTPIFAVIAVFLLSVFGRTRLKAFAGAMFVLTTGWVCYGASPFWSGHLGTIFGGFGAFGSDVSSDLTARLRGSIAHHEVVDVRVVQSVLTWTLALGGWALGIGRVILGRPVRADVRTAVILTVAPFMVLPVQSYGGEAGLRIYLFSLPGALCLASLVLTRDSSLGRRFVLGALTIVLVPMFIISAWGNDLTELVRPAEVSGVQALDRIAPRGATVMSLDGDIPWRFTDIGKYNYETDFKFTDPSKDVGSMTVALSQNPRGGYVFITTAQLLYGEQTYGVSRSWVPSVERLMIRSGKFRLVFANAATRIYQFHQSEPARK